MRIIILKRTSMKKIGFLHPTTFKLDGGAMFGIIPKPLWEKKIKPDNDNRILMSLRVMFYQTKNRFILIDTGIGDYHSEKFNHQFEISNTKTPLISALKKINISPEDITDIILTHLHFDHVGGLGSMVEGNITPLFPKATLHLHKNHETYALKPTKKDSGSFQKEYFTPLVDFYKDKNQLHYLEGSEGNILKDEELNLNFKTSFGHTPYMIHPFCNEYIYMADIVPTAHHIRIPWVMGYDMMPGVATENKEEMYQFILKNKLTMIFEHDVEHYGATIKEDGKGDYIYSELFPITKESVAIIKD